MTEGRARVAGHFGELIQGRLGPGGPICLISLPCPVLAVEARLSPGRQPAVHGAGQRLLTPERARRFLADLGLALRGSVVLRADMPAGGGAGASTAALVALARAAGWRGNPLVLARACIRAEGASDPLMFAAPARLLWASRAARVVETLPPLPRFDVIGGFHGDPRRTDAADMDFPDIGDLVPRWRDAAAAGDAATVAGLASLSARRTIGLRGRAADPTEALATQLGAMGFVIGHTGSARGLLFPPGRIPATARSRLREAGFRGIVHFRAGGMG